MKIFKFSSVISKTIRLWRSTALLSSLLIQCCFVHASARADSSATAPQLSQIEQRLFFRDYSDEDDAVRLSRIEKNIFGEARQGGSEERLGSINAALPNEKATDKETNRNSTPSSRGSAIGSQQKSTFAGNAMTRPISSPAPYSSQVDGGQDDSDQQKMAVLAAKQKEILELQSEGVALWKSKKAVRAMEKFAQVVRLDPHSAQAYFSMGVIYEAQGNVAQAMNNYQQAQRLEPENNDYNLAIEAVNKKIDQKEKLNQGDPQLHQLANDAASAYRNGEYLSALDLYKQLDEKSPNQAIVKWNVGSLYLIIKNPQMALKFYKEACKLNPSEERYKQALKQLEENIKAEEQKEKKSENAWKKASQSGDDQPDSNQARKQAERKSKTTTKAKKDNALLYYGITAKHSKEGAKIVRIEPNSRAAQVGLKVDDLVKAVDGTVTTDGEDVNKILLSKAPGTRFQFTVQRGTKLGQILF